MLGIPIDVESLEKITPKTTTINHFCPYCHDLITLNLADLKGKETHVQCKKCKKTFFIADQTPEQFSCSQLKNDYSEEKIKSVYPSYPACLDKIKVMKDSSRKEVK